MMAVRAARPCCAAMFVSAGRGTARRAPSPAMSPPDISSRSTARLVGFGSTMVRTPRSVAARPTHPHFVLKIIVRASVVRARRAVPLLLFDDLDLEVDVHVVADHQPAAVEDLAPLHSEVLPVDLAMRGEPGPRVPHRILRHEAVKGPGQDNLPGHAQQGQVALRHVLIVADLDRKS